MLKRTKRESSGLEKAIDQILLEMQGYTCDEPEYNAMTDQLDKLYKLKEIDKPKRVSQDTLVLIAGNVFITLMIVAYEQKSIMTTKAPQFWSKLR